jgi:hypothetical protein|tara:strand:- start:34 stop:216 length:183 start_codon:yes stop_codon:yes gene_type:complete
MVDAGEDPEADRIEDNVMKMSNNKVGITNVNIYWHSGKHDSGNASKDKVEKAAKAKEHWS